MATTVDYNYQPQTAPARDPNGQAAQDAIMKQLAALQAPTDMNSASLRAQTDAYHLQNQRGLVDTQRQNAERAYAQGGLNSGGFDQQQQRAAENAAAAQAQFTGNAYKDAEAQRLARLSDVEGKALSAGQYNDSLANQQNQFGQQQQFNYRNLLQQGNQFDANLNQNQDQFTKTQAQQADQFTRNLDQTGALTREGYANAAGIAGGQNGVAMARVNSDADTAANQLAYQYWNSSAQQQGQQNAILAALMGGG